jgi:hypothetical protein
MSKQAITFTHDKTVVISTAEGFMVPARVDILQGGRTVSFRDLDDPGHVFAVISGGQ